jgi:hypothetical protein
MELTGRRCMGLLKQLKNVESAVSPGLIAAERDGYYS